MFPLDLSLLKSFCTSMPAEGAECIRILMFILGDMADILVLLVLSLESSHTTGPQYYNIIILSWISLYDGLYRPVMLNV